MPCYKNLIVSFLIAIEFNPAEAYQSLGKATGRRPEGIFKTDYEQLKAVAGEQRKNANA
jgi:hypothetical protein